MTAPLLRESFRLSFDEEPGRVIRGRVEAPAGEGRLPWVLVLHGFKGFMSWGFFPELSRRIARAGFVAVSFDMSGSGIGEDPETISEDEAFARNTPSRELEDTQKVRAFVLAGGVPRADPARAAILGHSFGGGVALVHASEHPGAYGAVVGWAAVSTFARQDDATVRRWREEGFLRVPNARTGQVHRLRVDWLDDLARHAERLDVAAACRALRAPTLLVHGTADEAVPFAEAERLLARLPDGVGSLAAIEGAGHTFGATHPPKGVPPALEDALARTEAHLRRALAPG